MTKHRPAIAPFACAHCHLVWYGHAARHYALDAILCVPCHIALNVYLERVHEDLVFSLHITDEQQRALDDAVTAWIADVTRKPYRRLLNERFDRSVPYWMRSAINQGMVAPRASWTQNRAVRYIVESDGNVAMSVKEREQ